MPVAGTREIEDADRQSAETLDLNRSDATGGAMLTDAQGVAALSNNDLIEDPMCCDVPRLRAWQRCSGIGAAQQSVNRGAGT